MLEKWGSRVFDFLRIAPTDHLFEPGLEPDLVALLLIQLVPGTNPGDFRSKAWPPMSTTKMLGTDGTKAQTSKENAPGIAWGAFVYSMWR